MATRPGSNAALVVVDVQVDVVATAGERYRIVGNVALAVSRAREAGVSVVWVQHEDEELKRDTPGWQRVPKLRPRPGETRIDKRYKSAF
jgi:nicotinamidase-related amidase